MQNPDLTGEVPQQDAEDALVLFGSLSGQDLLDLGRLDVVFEVNLEPLQPQVEVLGRGLDLPFLQKSTNHIIIRGHFQNIFEEDTQQVGNDVAALLLHAGFSFGHFGRHLSALLLLNGMIPLLLLNFLNLHENLRLLGLGTAGGHFLPFHVGSPVRTFDTFSDRK